MAAFIETEAVTWGDVRDVPLKVKISFAINSIRINRGYYSVVAGVGVGGNSAATTATAGHRRTIKG
jgi:hypothetical protein